jgi:hypothetical protein
VWSDALTIPPEEVKFASKDTKFDLSAASMRIHELALQHWLNDKFLIAEGAPVPLIFTKPMSAFADFRQIWSQENGGPFSYLSKLKDSEGRPLYQPHPAPPLFPLLTVNRKSWTFNSTRSFSMQRWRHIGWPTVTSDVKLKDLGYAYQSFMPQAWDYNIQLDHYAVRPDTQAFFIQHLQQSFFPSASVPQFWMTAAYPGVYGLRKVRVELDGDITDATEEEPVNGYRVYRTTVNLKIEGWVPEIDYLPVPTFWSISLGAKAVSPEELLMNYQSIAETSVTVAQDLRSVEDNGIIENRLDSLPPVQ